jgi:hypothetical protein
VSEARQNSLSLEFSDSEYEKAKEYYNHYKETQNFTELYSNLIEKEKEILETISGTNNGTYLLTRGLAEKNIDLVPYAFPYTIPIFGRTWIFDIEKIKEDYGDILGSGELDEYLEEKRSYFKQYIGMILSDATHSTIVPPKNKDTDTHPLDKGAAMMLMHSFSGVRELYEFSLGGFFNQESKNSAVKNIPEVQKNPKNYHIKIPLSSNNPSAAANSFANAMRFYLG